MPKSSKLCLAVPMLLGCFAWACFGSHREKASGTAVSDINAREANLSAASEIADSQLLRARVEAQLRALPTAEAVPVARVVEAPTRVLDPDLARRLPSAAVLQSHYDAALAAERADARWAPAEESVVLAFFASDAAKGARLEKAECRESMCRIRVRFDDHEARARFLTKIGTPPFQHGGFYRTDDASGIFTLYSAREGRTLPSLDSGPI